ncbi:hypothetical protein KUF83_29960 [Streptomyces sp. BV286]|uniref:hypothetical protein n=1 Tax=Streptomyces sp. BV286 TaxID=2849672 RepID=UPI001C2E9CF4|nr:hypothetical protein [Streptomyces sp. BV286]MBV1940761.1 hypothetical protein [Streptomyces sp. BV286]
MTVYDYQPVHGGALHDPGASGGQATQISLYASAERTGTPVATAGPAVRLRATAYRFTLPDGLPEGRYWCTVTFIPGKDQPPVTDRTVKMDFPLGTGLLASAEQIADKLGVPLPLTASQRESYRDAIADAQSDVAGYLGRPLLPQPRTLTDVKPLYGYDLYDPRAWPVHELDDVVTVTSYSDNADGEDTYDVQLMVGLNAAAERPIVRYVIAHAAEGIRNSPTQPPGSTSTDRGRRVSSVSAEGQSVSFESAPVAGQAGALPALDSLAGYRKLVIRPLPVVAAAPWPYGRGRRYSRW